jgi:hypothetical protein
MCVCKANHLTHHVLRWSVLPLEVMDLYLSSDCWITPATLDSHPHPADEELALVGVCHAQVITQPWDEALHAEVRRRSHNVLQAAAATAHGRRTWTFQVHMCLHLCQR